MTDPIPSSARGGCLLKGLLLVAVCGILLVAAWTMLLPGIAVSTIQARTGFVVKVEKVSLNPFTGRVAIEGAVVENPAGWPATEFLTLRRFKADAEFQPLFSHRLVVDELIIDIAKLSLVRNKDGRLNAEVFRAGLAGETAKTETPKPSGRRTGFLIRHLVLKFDRLVMADHSGRKPVIRDYDLQLEQELRDVDSVAKLLTPFVGVAFNASRGLFDTDPAKRDEAINSLQKAGKKGGDSLKKFFQSLENEKP